jgi:hypothetical protein
MLKFRANSHKEQNAMNDRRHDSKSINNPGKLLLKLIAAAFVLLAAFCTPARAQIIASDVSSTNLGNGVTLDSVTINEDEQLFLLTLTLETQGRFVASGHSKPSSKNTPAALASAASVFAAYGVLFGTVTPDFATAAAAANGVSITFDQGKPRNPIVLGSLNNGLEASEPSVSQVVISKAAPFASPSLFNEALNGTNSLLTQFGFPNPLVPSSGLACGGVADQFDVDSNGNLLVRVFQGSGAPLVDATVTISLSSTTFPVQATTDANGLAAFNGTDNTVPVASLSNITAITVQFSTADGIASSCVVQGNPAPPCNTFTDLSARPARVALKTQTEVNPLH